MSQVPGSTNDFLVCDRFNARAMITQDSWRERFKYTMLSGDPLEYGPVLELLRSDHALDSEGFASADAWIAATLQHRYPVALERIARGLSSATLNPATILLSLDNRYVHANFWVFFASRLATCAGTHGGLDDLNSTGITLSNFTATDDTIARKLPQQFAYFAGRNQTLSRAKARNNSPPPPRDRHHLTFNVGSGK